MYTELKPTQKLTTHQFTEAAFIFERVNGYPHSDYEKKVISGSDLAEMKPAELERIIVAGLNSAIYKSEAERTSAYWALQKIGNRDLIPDFRRWLQIELEDKNGIAVFQLLVALDILDEPAFHAKRNSRGSDEIELNLRDAGAYLKKLNI